MLLLDVHPHALPGLMPGNELSRKALIDAAKQITDRCDALLSTGVAETLDCCTLAFLNDVLRGSVTAGAVTHRTDMPVPLHEAIRCARSTSDGVNANGGSLSPATKEEVSNIAEWLSDRIFSDAWQVLADREAREARGESTRIYGRISSAPNQRTRAPFSRCRTCTAST